jgi:hypothetical protein
MQGKKTHEQQVRILERKPDVPDARQMEESMNAAGGTMPSTSRRKAFDRANGR